jgi:predicted glycoside hydrolase/deacetylase ChbG (UPF0249 family)
LIKLIVNADDFGYSRGVNYGIIDAHKNGIVNSATMMMNMPGVGHAIELAIENPTLQVGIHLVLTCGKPILPNVPSLCDGNGNFKKLTNLLDNKEFSLEELEREWTAQIDRFLGAGLIPTHFDSHHHVHSIPELLPVVQKLAKKYEMSARQMSEQPIQDVPSYTDVFLPDFYGESAKYNFFEHLPERVLDGQTVEVMCHPAYLDHALLSGSSYAADRVRETDILTSVSLPGSIVLL